jgi:16S rRNA processing protein RimM
LTAERRRASAGRVGRAHGLDGSFYVNQPADDLAVGTEVEVGGLRAVVERRAGTAQRPIVRLAGISDRSGAEALHGESLLVHATEPGEGEYLIEDLVGCEVPGLGPVRRVLTLPSCDVLEVGDDAVLVPLVADAVTRVDLDARVIEVDRGFLGLDEEPA